MWRVFVGWPAAIVVATALAGAPSGCGFQAAEFDGDGGTRVAVGFLSPTSLQDEMSDTVMIKVELSAPAGAVVTVPYRFSGGSADHGTDYLGTDGVLTFPPGSVEQTIPVTINQDGLEEPSETIDVTLDGATGAILGARQHRITISSDILPRVTFTTPTSAATEDSTPTLSLQLDVAATNTVSVDYVVTGTASVQADYAVIAGTITFPPGVTSQELPLGIVNDALDEFDENLLVTLTSSQNVVVGAAASHDHMILDNDDPPTVGFLAATQTTAEGNTNVDVTVKLSAPSGKAILVDLSGTTSTSTTAPTLGTDYTYPASMQLAFPAGTMQQTFVISVLADTTDEFDEDIVTALTVQPTYNVTLGTVTTNTLTIADDDNPPTASLTTASQTVNEGNSGTTPYEYVVTLSAASQKPITIPLVITGNALDPGDYTITGNPVTIAPGLSTGAVTVNVVGDTVKETTSNGTKDVIMTIAANVLLTNATRAGTAKTLTIRDDD